MVKKPSLSSGVGVADMLFDLFHCKISLSFCDNIFFFIMNTSGVLEWH